jgi:hypothetical protein
LVLSRFALILELCEKSFFGESVLNTQAGTSAIPGIISKYSITQGISGLKREMVSGTVELTVRLVNNLIKQQVP